MNYVKLTRDEIAKRIAQDIPEGSYVNLGIGMPTLVANHLPREREIFLHSENGILGMGPAPAPGAEDADLIKRYGDAGVARLVFNLNPAKADEVLPALDRCAGLMRQAG